ncbi:MAG: hemC [Bacteroidetes bacterium]|nr:hemC [Bacteroidota bacterium]
MKSRTVRIGSRGSDLALWQARWVQGELLRLHPGNEVIIEVIKTTGDKILDAPLSKIGDKGLFTREIETALLEGRIDLAVHSLKDLPTELPDGLEIGAVSRREDPRDVFIPHPSNSIRKLMAQPPGAAIATGSLRRKCQIAAVRPDMKIVDIRGNLGTRFKKLESSDWMGMILARAGVVRLGWGPKIGETVTTEVILPAVGQGALGVEVRRGDHDISSLVAGLTDHATLQGTTAERALLRTLEGGCQVPIGAYGRVMDSANGRPVLMLDAMVGSLDGKKVVRSTIEGDPLEADTLGRQLAARLLAEGAEEILRQIRALKQDVNKPEA